MCWSCSPSYWFARVLQALNLISSARSSKHKRIPCFLSPLILVCTVQLCTNIVAIVSFLVISPSRLVCESMAMWLYYLPWSWSQAGASKFKVWVSAFCTNINVVARIPCSSTNLIPVLYVLPCQWNISVSIPNWKSIEMVLVGGGR